MTERINIPCLVADKNGWKPARLEIGYDQFGDAILVCSRVSCIAKTKFMRGIVGAAYQPMPVELDSTEGVSKVVSCSGGGFARRETS